MSNTDPNADPFNPKLNAKLHAYTKLKIYFMSGSDLFNIKRDEREETVYNILRAHGCIDFQLFNRSYKFFKNQKPILANIPTNRVAECYKALHKEHHSIYYIQEPRPKRIANERIADVVTVLN